MISPSKSFEKDIDILKNEIKQIEYDLTKETCEKMIGSYDKSDPNYGFVMELYEGEPKDVLEKFDFSKVELYINEEGHLSFNSEMFSGTIAGIGETDYLYDMESNKITTPSIKFHNEHMVE